MQYHTAILDSSWQVVMLEIQIDWFKTFSQELLEEFAILSSHFSLANQIFCHKHNKHSILQFVFNIFNTQKKIVFVCLWGMCIWRGVQGLTTNVTPRSPQAYLFLCGFPQNVNFRLKQLSYRFSMLMKVNLYASDPKLRMYEGHGTLSWEPDTHKTFFIHQGFQPILFSILFYFLAERTRSWQNLFSASALLCWKEKDTYNREWILSCILSEGGCKSSVRFYYFF